MGLGCIFIIYCYVANHQKLDVKTTYNYLSVSVGQPSQDMRAWILCSVSHRPTLKAGSHRKAQLVEGSPSKLITWLSAGFGSFGLLD